LPSSGRQASDASRALASACREKHDPVSVETLRAAMKCR